MRLLPLLVLSLLGALVQGEAVFDLQPSTQKCFGMYSKKSIPGAKKSPYIGLNIAEIQGESSYIIFNYEDREAIGYRHSETGEVSYICTQALKDANKCHSSEVNEFIVNDTKKHVSPIMKGGTYQIEDDDIIVSYEVEKKGYYCVFHQNLTQFSMVGVLKIQNPYGNLPADIYPNLPFYGTMSLVYLGVAILWGILCLCYWQQIMHIQLYINAIIFLCLCEMAFGYGYHTNYNISGTPSMGLLTFTVLLTSARNSASFIALLVVCMGYGVVKPTLGSTAKKIAAIGFAHFIFGTLFAASSMLQTASSQKLLALLFVFPLALTMTILYSWTFNSLNVTIKKLEIRRQSTKTTLYRRLWQLLAFSLLILFIFLIMTIVQRYDPQYEVEHWDTIWFTSDGWIHLLYFFMFIAILFLFRPTKNNNRYGMIEAATDDVDDGAMGSSAALANIKMRGLKRSKRQEESDEEDALQWVEENISDGEEIDPLTLEEEPEERIARRELAKMN